LPGPFPGFNSSTNFRSHEYDVPSSVPTDFPPQFDFASAEREIYERWQRAGAFSASTTRSTRGGGDRAALHDRDAAAQRDGGTAHGPRTRQHRSGRPHPLASHGRRRGALGAGTDHAGIATQNVVEKHIAKEGRRATTWGATRSLRRTVRFVDETGGAILGQLRALGASCDWSRTAYTLSPELSRAVREAFVRLLRERPRLPRTPRDSLVPALPDLAQRRGAEFHDTTGKLYHISYPLSGAPDRSIVVATTRPETMLGDVAVAVNPR
jgi:valyl-tRNA synthetase